MARCELTNSDRIGIKHAREALARSRETRMVDPMVMARVIGRLEASLADVLEILDPDGGTE
ncbi:hypothetical protein ACFU6S_03570 [Streptomyces sp. NPDC057456]|uniref:hypothetical protein n=1 Tax=Streptomyces sp. NPDC057456 TaxID=3346139 RepID=UPI003674F048